MTAQIKEIDGIKTKYRNDNTPIPSKFTQTGKVDGNGNPINRAITRENNGTNKNGKPMQYRCDAGKRYKGHRKEK